MRKLRQKLVKNPKSKASVPDAVGILRRINLECLATSGAVVHIVGSFNDWNASRTPLQDKNGDGMFNVLLALAPGRYEYKFVVNGQWRLDPKCPDPIVNEYGTLNGVFDVK